MKKRMCAVTAAALAIFIAGVALGSVRVPVRDVLLIIGSKTFGLPLPEGIKATTVAIIWNTRLPRVITAFLVGGALSASGAVMQSALRNPLASSYTLGVSSGASFGACLVILYGVSLPVLPFLTLPLTGFICGLLTIFAALAFAARADGRMRVNTIVLTGMVFSLFINAITTLLSAMAGDSLQKLVYWQMGSFRNKDWLTAIILAPICIAGAVYTTLNHRELDIMTFGEEQAQAIGVAIKRRKLALLTVSAAMTGAAISFAGVIGFVDLVAPHVVRRLFGPSHRYVVPMSAVAGGAFMTLCDLAARTVAAPIELPVGAVTALAGAPFFAYVYFRKGGDSRVC